MKKSALFYIILAGMLWGSSGIFSNLLAPYGFSSLQLTATRGIVSGVAIALYALIFDRKLFRVGGKQFLLHAVAGLSVFCTAASYYTAIRTSSVATAAVLMYTCPAFVMAYSVAFLGEKLTKKKLLCLIAMLAGCMLVSGIVSGLTFSFWGIVWGLSSGILYSVYCILSKVEAMHGYSSLTATLYHFIVMGAVGLFFLDLPTYTEAVGKMPPLMVPLLIAMGLCTCVLPYFLFSLSLEHVPVGIASALGIVEPVAATLYSVIFFKEALSVPAIIGIVLVLGSCLVIGAEKEEKVKAE